MKMRGFTLIELMIVIGIIGILATFLLSAYQRYQQNGDHHFRDTPANAEVVTDRPSDRPTDRNVGVCTKISESPDGVIHKCPDGTVLQVK